MQERGADGEAVTGGSQAGQHQARPAIGRRTGVAGVKRLNGFHVPGEGGEVGEDDGDGDLIRAPRTDEGLCGAAHREKVP